MISKSMSISDRMVFTSAAVTVVARDATIAGPMLPGRAPTTGDDTRFPAAPSVPGRLGDAGSPPRASWRRPDARSGLPRQRQRERLRRTSTSQTGYAARLLRPNTSDAVDVDRPEPTRTVHVAVVSSRAVHDRHEGLCEQTVKVPIESQCSDPYDPRESALTGSGLTLKPRQAEILEHLATGARTSQIAAALFLSPQAVSYHITQMLTQFEVESRTGLVARAYHYGVLDRRCWPPKVSLAGTTE
jgi:DNA-binding CsgD family transcriptional regulator